MYTDIREKSKQIGTLSAVYFGLLLGLLLGYLFSLGMTAVAESLVTNPNKLVKITPLLRGAITLICCFVTISTLLQTKDDFRFIIPYVEFSKQVKGNRPLVLDTSVIIDGRIADVCDTRIVDSRLIVPRFVLQELQGIADSSDKLKRNRGRRGLDILKRLQTNTKVELEMHDGNVAELRTPEKIRVDEMLVIFTKAIGGRVVTNDFNLNKLAQLQGVDVINLNEVANSLKTVALPGEYLLVRVVKPGDQIGQGVGYLDDGTMVVIEGGKNLINQEVSILVTSVLQTPAGRMIFGRPEARPSGSYSPVSGSHHPVGGPSVSGGTGTFAPVGPPSSAGMPPVQGPGDRPRG
ncbi:MAG TPA: TRAM domain-containing protein [Fimbriiglobus sp.]